MREDMRESNVSAEDPPTAGPTATGDVRSAETERCSASQLGVFAYDRADGSWEWSPEIYTMYGFEVGEIVPSTELLLAHIHPDHAAAAQQYLCEYLLAGRSFAWQHRIIDARQLTRHVMMLSEGTRNGAGDRNGTGGTERTVGYLVDHSETQARLLRDETQHHLQAILTGRVLIERAKGSLMLTYGVDEQSAWQLLREQSQQDNVKVRDFAAQLLEDITSGRTFPRQNHEPGQHLLLKLGEHLDEA
jgi:hypothetical protein